MKRKTAIEWWAHLCFDEQASKELRALLRLAKVINPWISSDLSAKTQEGRAVLRLRRLGVLPEVRRG